ncbi:uncharacterized protein [Miscanthus floridulus]|uniref:uncharacterized protein isoform X2 n=1 Tax=Miscanthus floridulus TaxID=154761 RepID=UPI0034586D38
MQSSPGCPAPLLPVLSAELARLEAQLGQTADRWARAHLAELGDAAAARVLRVVAETGTRVRSLSAFINHLAKQEAMQRNAAGIPTAESAACCNGPSARASQEDSISGPFYQDVVQMEVQNQGPNGEMAFARPNHARMEPGSPVRQMPFRYMELNILERIVNESEEPSPLDFALLQSITENFAEKKEIGSGGCGTVYKGILRNGVVAVKRLHNTRTIKDKMFHREVKSLFSVKHPNIVRFLGYCSFTKEHAIPLGGRIIMADIRERLLCFEYIRNGSLDQHLSDELRGLEWQTRYQIIIGICRGLHYLHKDKEIIHMDLKPGNILLDDLMVPKITDFGLSRPESDSLATTTRLISQGYTAPEYISGGKATSKSDIYSLGVIIIELVIGSRTKPNITKAIRRWNHRWIKSMKQSSLACQQVKKCLELALRCIQDDPTDRPDISDIIDELKEIDTTDGQAQIQISSCCLEDILGIEPLEIRIPFEDFKISHSIELTNDTDDYIAFVTKAKLERFCTEPDRGIVPPRSKCSVTLAMQAQVNAQPNVHYTEVITVLSTRVDGALSVDAMDVTSGEIFVDKEGKVVDEVDVMVVFGTPQLAEE